MNNSNIQRALSISAAYALSLTVPLSTHAAAERAVLEEIVVTARRIEENIQDVPISIAVYTQAQLTDLNVTSAVDLATITPSVAANPSFGSENASLAIRGFNQDIDTAPSVGVYFADVIVPRGATQGTGSRDVLLPGSMFDLQNIQVLKGPRGTLFGRNTTGGAVLLVPQKPSNVLSGYVETSVGNYDMQRLQAMANVPLGDSAGLRIAADRQRRDGYLENTLNSGSKDFEDLNYEALRVSLVWDITENLENYTVASHYKSDTHGTLTKLIACNPTGYDPVNIVTGLPNFIGGLSCGQLDSEASQGAGFHDVATPARGTSLIEQWQVINTTTWNLDETHRIKNILSYGEYQNTQHTPLFGTNWQVETLPPPYPALFFRDVPQVFTGINAAPGRHSADQSTYTEELQLQGSSLQERLTYQIGVYFEWSDPESDSGNQSATLLICEDFARLECIDPLGSAFTPLAGMPINIGAAGDGIGQTTFRNQGLYAHSTYDFTDQLKLTTGIRYTWDEQKSDRYGFTTVFPVTPPYAGAPTTNCTDISTQPTCKQSRESKSDKPTWLVGLDYFPVDDVMIYGKYARGYRAGGIVSRGPFDYSTFDAEKLDSYELGLKTSFLGAVRGTFNVAIFYNELSNQQFQIGFGPGIDENGNASTVAPTTGIVNAGESTIYGAEIEASLIPMEGLILNLSYTFLDTEIKQLDEIATIDPLYQADNDAIEPGSPIFQTPKNQLNLSANYELPLDEGFGRISLGLTYVYIDDRLTTYTYQDPEVLAIYGGDLGQLSSIELWNANLNWNNAAGLPIDLSFFVTNLLDEEYYGYVPGLGANGLETAVLGQPRMYGLRLRYRLGDGP
ncbi:MAG: iron complex outermembrane receptor protein [Halieaceae bacterium]|jgi:iron complex outermembrane receptor protein